MNYNEYDLLMQYQISQKRAQYKYNGDTEIYQDTTIPIEIFPEIDSINNQVPAFVFATVVYLYYPKIDKYLVLKQTKENRVVNNYVGLGGKVKAMRNNSIMQNEKASISAILAAYNDGELNTEEDMKLAATREVLEETSTYSKDENGNYTHEIIKLGLYVNPNRLINIGNSRIRIIKPNNTESWMILNYRCDLSDMDYTFLETEVAKENREGKLEWLSLEQLVAKQTFADQTIMLEQDKNTTVYEIRDLVNKKNILRIKTEKNDQTNYEVVIRSNDEIEFSSKIGESKNDENRTR